MSTQLQLQSKGDLKTYYNVSAPTIRSYLKKVPGINPNQRKFTPKEINCIISHIGKPE